MSEEKYICIGRIHSAQGLKGDVFIHIFSGEAAWKKKWTSLELGEKGSKSPSTSLPIESKREHNKQNKSGYALRLQGVDDRNKAEELIGLSVFIPESFLVSKKGEKIYLREILHFNVMDENRGEIGQVQGFSDNGAQEIIRIEDKDKNLSEVPLVEPILVRIDFENKEIIMNIPLGLLAGDEP